MKSGRWSIPGYDLVVFAYHVFVISVIAGLKSELRSYLQMDSSINQFLRAIEAKVSIHNVFGEIHVDDSRLKCAARHAGAQAWYCLEHEDEQWFVSLVTADRWLSESIETDLLHLGDPIDELVDEELEDLDYEGSPLTVKHYRSENMLYTFRSVLPIQDLSSENARDVATSCLLAYEAAFRELGDMMMKNDG